MSEAENNCIDARPARDSFWMGVVEMHLQWRYGYFKARNKVLHITIDKDTSLTPVSEPYRLTNMPSCPASILSQEINAELVINIVVNAITAIIMYFFICIFEMVLPFPI